MSGFDSNSEITDEELIDLCINGNNKSFAQLVERYSRMVFNFSFRVLGNTEDAEDACQEAFLRVYIALPRFRKKSKFSTWLYSIVSNVCTSHKTRKEKREQIIETHEKGLEDIQTNEEFSSPEDNLLERELSEKVREIIASLPAQYSIIIVLRYFNEFTYEEISEVLKLPMANVKTHLFRAKKMLRELAMKNEVLSEETFSK